MSKGKEQKKEPTKYYIAEKEVKGVQDMLEQTPQKKKIIRVKYTDGSEEVMPELRYKAMVSTEQSDATKAREQLVNELASLIYGQVHEYDLRLTEVDPVLNQIAALANNAAIEASNRLWEVDHSDDRSLLKVNNVLMKYVINKESVDGSSSDGEGTSGEDKE